jgi:hypothetical protein
MKAKIRINRHYSALKLSTGLAFAARTVRIPNVNIEINDMISPPNKKFHPLNLLHVFTPH